MGSPAVHSTAAAVPSTRGQPLRVAFAGPQVWLDACAPPRPALGLDPAWFPTPAPGRAEAHADAWVSDLTMRAPHVCVLLDPLSLDPALLEGIARTSAVTLGVLTGGLPAAAQQGALASLDRVLSFRPALTGAALGSGEIWRAIPPPVSDALFGEVRPLHSLPRAMSVGSSTEHREAMLMPAKHHHDLLQVIHGISGQPLAELLSEYDVGVWVSSEPGGGFGWQICAHLAAGQLLLAETLHPEHGLERDIDYLHVGSPEGLVWTLDRLGRFPEMHQRVRVRGRMKAEQFRASRVFARVLSDLLADVAAFDRSDAAPGGA
jgi:hypothetical protein